MKKGLIFVLILVLGAGMALAACGGGGAQNTQAPADQTERPAPPPEYAAKTNPKVGDSTAIEAGKTVFQTNCASCHGQDAKGDGPAAASLNPKPSNLAANAKDLSDGYLDWRISEGGAIAPYHSAMPAWKNILTEDQIWNVIAYLKSL